MIPVHDLFESHLNVTGLATLNEFFGPNAGIRACEGVLGAASCFLLDWWARQLDARFVGREKMDVAQMSLSESPESEPISRTSGVCTKLNVAAAVEARALSSNDSCARTTTVS